MVGVLYRNSEVVIWTLRLKCQLAIHLEMLKKGAEFSNLKSREELNLDM